MSSGPGVRRSMGDGSSGGLALSEAFEYDGSSCIDESVRTGSGISGGIAADHRETLMNERKIVERMAENETQKVRLWRRNVLIVMVLTGVAVTIMAYIFLASVDQDDFEASFQQFAQSIQDSTEFNLRGLIEATNGLAQVYTSEAIKTNSQWPFMTLSSFEVYVRNTRAQGSSELIVIAPFVNATQIPDWNAYATANQGWIDESFQEYDTGRLDLNPIPSSVYRFGRFKGRTVLKPEDGLGRYPTAPFWQMSRPPFDTSIVNFNALSEEAYQQMYDAMTDTNHWVMGIAGPNTLIDYTISEAQHDELHSASEVTANATGFANDHPHTALLYPVYRDKNASHPSGSDIYSPQVAMILNIIPWDNYLKRLLPDGVNGIYCVLHNSAGQAFTYRISGPDAAYLGAEDMHERDFDKYEVRINFAAFLDMAPPTVTSEYTGKFVNYGNLEYWLSIYPSQQLKSGYETSTPIIFAFVVVSVFLFMTVTFILYDRFVTQKNKKILDAATHSNAILASLFPQNVKERLLEDKAEEVRAEELKHKEEKKLQKKGAAFKNNGMDQSLEDILQSGNQEGGDENDEILKSKPIADVFEESTVLFADLVGFTAWSSTRQPTDVFVLLETLYRNFDFIAKRRRVYKVETIGDCYVAVTGCPTPRKDHHVAMCRFATECMRKMKKLCRKLESTLGPDTSDLNMRFGLHSGPVTGGVLRGERSRFQLFGDTMNTAARMESNGKPGKVHLSGATADLLTKSGKEHWLEKREDKIVAKGKGEMQTYWLNKVSAGASSVVNGSDKETSSDFGDDDDDDDDMEVSMGDGAIQLNARTQRVVDWVVQSLMNILERLATARETHGLKRDILDKSTSPKPGATPLEELQDVVSFHRYPGSKQDNVTDIVLDQHIEDQLELYVAIISTKYGKKNKFHSFDHASVVLQTVLKLFSRMGGSDDELDISADPLAVFAAAFTALVHDVEHPGVGNATLKSENPGMAATYKGRSIAEQHSFAVAWNLLQEERFKDLRETICPDQAEEARFRQLVVTSMMATDFFDKKLSEQRIQRWIKAFQSGGTSQEEQSPKQVTDRKATIVLEHLIQVADISHTMQHWQIYRRWNDNLYGEEHQAFIEKRDKKDPTRSWYQGELDFFDRHVIPLATKFQELGCFGTLGNEFLQNATQNRHEWSERGHEIVKEMRSSTGKPQDDAAAADVADELPPPVSPARQRVRSIRQSAIFKGNNVQCHAN